MTEKTENARPVHLYQRIVSHRDALEAARKLRPLQSGHQFILRFSRGARIQHAVLLLAVGMLALTGFVQVFNNTAAADLIFRVLGGLDAAQSIHHVSGIVLIVLGVLHFLTVINIYFIQRGDGSILIDGKDLGHLFDIIRLNLGLSKKLPLYDRYSPDEKLIYWLTFFTSAGLILTGLVMWFPTQVTQVLPGQVFPFSVVFHRWLAILLVSATLILHGYQVFLRRRNFSIFTGRISLTAMEEDHPVELAYLQTAARQAEEKAHWNLVEFSIEDRRVSQQNLPVIEQKANARAAALHEEEIVAPAPAQEKAGEVEPAAAAVIEANTTSEEIAQS